MRRLLDVLALGFILGAISLQGAFLTAIAGVAGGPSAQVARAAARPSAPVSAQVCASATDRKC